MKLAEMVAILLAAALVDSTFAFSTTSLSSCMTAVVDVQPHRHSQKHGSSIQQPRRRRRRRTKWPLFADSSGGVSTAVQAAGDGDDEFEDDEAILPSDPASTTTEFLAGLWQLIAQGNSLVRGVRVESV